MHVTYTIIFRLSTRNGSTLSSFVVCYIHLSLNGLFIIHMRKVHFLQDSEANMLYEDMLQDNNVVLLVSFVQ